MFPVGALDKAAVREHARELGLPVADKPDSHEICFVADGDHAAFLERHGERRPGEGTIRDVGGRSSAGTTASIASRSASGRGSGSPRRSRSTSSASMPAPTAVTVGPREALERATLDAHRGVNWIAGGAAAGRHARHRADPPSPSRGRRAPSLRCPMRRVEVDVRRAADRGRARAGGRVLRRETRWSGAGGSNSDRGCRWLSGMPMQSGIRFAFIAVQLLPRCCGTPSRYFSASIAAMQPDPAAVMAWR